MTLNKRIKRIFREHMASYIGMTVLIILSTSCYLGLKTASTSIEKNVRDNRIESNMEDANFIYSNRLTTQEITVLEKEYNLTLQKNKYIEENYNNAVLRIRPEYKKINKHVVFDGKELSNPRDIMVDRFFLEAQGLSLGDKIKISGTEFKISGIFTSPDYLSMLRNKSDFMCDGSKFGLCMISSNDYDNLVKGTETIYYSVVFQKENEESFRKYLAQNGMIINWNDKNSNNRISNFDGEITALIMISKIAPLFILIVSSIIMGIIMGRMLKKEYAYIGTLTAMGYKKREIIIHYLHLPLIISIIGSILGIILGIFLTKPFTLISLMEYNIPPVTYYYNWLDVITILLVPAALNCSGAMLSVIKALRINTVALLKANSNKQKKGLLTRLIPNKIGSFKVRFKLKEIASNIPRSLLMLLGIIVSSMFILTGFLFDSAIEFLFDNNFHDKFGYEYQYVFNQPLYENKTNGEHYMVATFDYNKGDETLNVTINGIADNPRFIKLLDLQGNLIDYDKTVMTSSVAKRLELKKGDTIIIKNHSNLKEYSITIDDICDIQYSDNIYMPIKQLNKLLDLPEDTHIGLYSENKLKLDENQIMNVFTSQDSKAGLQVSIAAFKVFLYIMAFFSAVIGVIVIYIVTVMLIEENKKNISMLKVIGYHNKEISRLLINSTALLVWMGFVIAIPLTNKIIQVFFDSLTSNMYFSFTVNLRLWQGIMSFIFILVTYYLTLLLSKKKVLNINMSESLKARE